MLIFFERPKKRKLSRDLARYVTTVQEPQYEQLQ